MTGVDSWVTGTVFSAELAPDLIPLVVESVRDADFILLAENQNPAPIAEKYPGGRIYAGTVSCLGDARPTLIFIRDAGEFVVAIQMPEPDDEDDPAALDAIISQSVDDSLGTTLGRYKVSGTALASIVELKRLLGCMVRNDL